MTHPRMLRELAKVGTGLFIADLASVIWLGSAGFFPLTILGVTWTASALVPIAVFDIAIIILLVHVGWNMKLPIQSPSERRLLMIAGLIFAAVALLHLVRLAFGLEFILGTFMVPTWLSWLGVIITGYLSYSCFHFGLRAKQ